ncbi:hypothetical protein PG994_008201 [Apiospora phragmitis]|uniref:Uncharacterized protein n=1 Tax=Apiospora phragmitis TaxID=2905665 RepID=A0ABR1UUV8_9PEZI
MQTNFSPTNVDWLCIDGEQIDWWAGRFGLDTWCDAGNMLDPHHIYSWHYNGTTAYICNYAGRQNCQGQEYIVYKEVIADSCGDLSPASGDKPHGRGLVGERPIRLLLGSLHI